jgi:hypothetical protein
MTTTGTSARRRGHRLLPATSKEPTIRRRRQPAREVLMAARILLTLAMLLLAAGGFFGAAPNPAGPLNPFGILFLFVSGVIWFAWDLVREAFGNRLDVITVRLGPMARYRPVDRSTSDASTTSEH